MRQTIDTCGPLFTASSPHADRQRSLANRLQARLGVDGSPEYELTWMDWDMPFGLPICRLRAYPRHIRGNGFGGWPTPMGEADSGSSKKMARGNPTLAGAAGMAEWPTPAASDPKRGTTPPTENMTGTNLSAWAAMAGWSTPRGSRAIQRRTRALNHNSKLEDQVHLVGWSTPTAQDGNRGSRPPRPHDKGFPLSQQVVVGWPTPAARDWKSERGPGHQERMAQTRGKPLSRLFVAMASRGALAPAFSLWLMGYPGSWLSSAPHVFAWRKWQVLMAPLSAPLRHIGMALLRQLETLSSRS